MRANAAKSISRSFCSEYLTTVSESQNRIISLKKVLHWALSHDRSGPNPAFNITKPTSHYRDLPMKSLDQRMQIR